MVDFKVLATKMNAPIANGAEKVVPAYNNFIAWYGDLVKPVAEKLGTLGVVSACFEPYRQNVAKRPQKDREIK